MKKPKFPKGECQITDDWLLHDMRVIYMENDWLKIGILAGRGSDIFEFTFKPMGLDFMLRLNKGIRNPATDFSQRRDIPNLFEDYYYGGWQETLPNSPSFVYRKASLGQHGEVALIPWKHSIVENSKSRVAVKLWVRPLRVPLLLEKTLILEAGSPTLRVEERLINESKTDLDIMWGHHIAFGLPFLTEGGFIESNATLFETETEMPDFRRFKSGEKGAWPTITDKSGKPDDARVIPPESAESYCELAYLSGFPEEATYTLWNASKDVGFQVSWPSDVFSSLWYWQERYATQDAPWWGAAYAVGLEPWTSKWVKNPEEAISKGEWLKIKAGEVRETSLSAKICTK